MLLTRLFATHEDRLRFPEVFAAPPRQATGRLHHDGKNDSTPANCNVRVLILGMPRTGTTSLFKALTQIGIAPSYHMVDWIKTPSDTAHWAHAVQTKYAAKSPEDVKALHAWASGPPSTKRNGLTSHEYWDPIFRSYEAIIDVPGAAFMPELVKAYPNAKVIIVERDPEKWLQSYMNTVHHFLAGTTFSRVISWLAGDVPRQRLRKTLQVLMTCLFDGHAPSMQTSKEKKRTLQRYHEIHEELRQCVAPDRCLEWKFEDGWAPLCTFLGIADVPATPFPHVNDTASFQRRVKLMRVRMLDSILERWVPRLLMGFFIMYAAIKVPRKVIM